MHPILTRYGSFLYFTYTAVMGLGLALALGLAAFEGGRQTSESGSGEGGLSRPTVRGLWSVSAGWLDGVIIALLTALVAGRGVFVAANWDYYVDNLDETWLLWQGGISYHGAVGAGFLVLWLWSRWRGVSFERLGGMLAMPMVVWTAFGWLACLLEGCAYGRETFIGPLSADLPDSFGVYAVRYQTQLMGLLFSFLALVVLLWTRRHLRPGTLFWFAVLLLSASRTVVDTFRGDAMPLIAGLRVDLLLDSGLALIALAAFITSLTDHARPGVVLQNRPTHTHRPPDT